MNRFFTFITAAFCSAAMLTSCDPAGSSAEGSTSRLATIEVKDNNVYLRYDPTTLTREYSAQLDNFKTVADMEQFNLKEGDRGIADISYYTNTSDNFSSFTLAKFNVIKPDTLNWSDYAQDTLGTYMHFNILALDYNVTYQGVWSNGHVASTLVTYYPDPDTPKEQNFIDMYIHGLRNDTLSLLAVATVPNSDYVNNGYNYLLQYDLSALRTANNEKAARIMAQLDEQKGRFKDSVWVEITTCDSLFIYNNKHPRTVKGDRMYTRIPLDF